MNIGLQIIRKAQKIAQRKWNEGKFDEGFRLIKNPRASMKEMRATVEVEISECGDIVGVVIIPSGCGCCPDDKAYFSFEFKKGDLK